MSALMFTTPIAPTPAKPPRAVAKRLAADEPLTAYLPTGVGVFWRGVLWVLWFCLLTLIAIVVASVAGFVIGPVVTWLLWRWLDPRLGRAGLYFTDRRVVLFGFHTVVVPLDAVLTLVARQPRRVALVGDAGLARRPHAHPRRRQVRCRDHQRP